MYAKASHDHCVFNMTLFYYLSRAKHKTRYEVLTPHGGDRQFEVDVTIQPDGHPVPVYCDMMVRQYELVIRRRNTYVLSIQC